MILVKQFGAGDRLIRKFYVKDPKKVEHWQRMSKLETIGVVTRIYGVKKD